MIKFKDYPQKGYIEIEGVRYSHEIFKEWAHSLPVGTAFRLIKRETDLNDGTVLIVLERAD